MTAKKDYTSIIFVLGVLVFYTAWMLASPYAAPPDENMRYDIPMYIYKYGVLPRGDDPALINNAWGLSYAFFPILSYMGLLRILAGGESQPGRLTKGEGIQAARVAASSRPTFPGGASKYSLVAAPTP